MNPGFMETAGKWLEDRDFVKEIFESRSKQHKKKVARDTSAAAVAEDGYHQIELCRGDLLCAFF